MTFYGDVTHKLMAEMGRNDEALKFIDESELTGGSRPEFSRIRKQLIKN